MRQVTDAELAVRENMKEAKDDAMSRDEVIGQMSCV